MTDEVELIGDEKGVAVIGEPDAVKRFLSGKGLFDTSEQFTLKDLGKTLRAASGAADSRSAQIRDSGRYIKLTKESAELRKQLGLTPTKTKGTSYAMLGDPGNIGKWLKVEEGSATLFTNPAVLSGIAGLLEQSAKQQEATELRDLLERIDKKLDDVRRRQKDGELNKLDGIALAIQEANEIRDEVGDLETAWEKVLSRSTAIYEVQHAALREMKALADRASEGERISTVVNTTREIEYEAGVCVSVLAWSSELRNELKFLNFSVLRSGNQRNLTDTGVH